MRSAYSNVAKQYAGAARAAATLGWLFRERGDISRAKSTFERARVLFDVAAPAGRSAPASTASRSCLVMSEQPDPGADGGSPRRVEGSGGEYEDYMQAKAMLSAGEIIRTASSAARDEADDALRLTQAAGELFRAYTRNAGLQQLCATVRSLVEAEAVAVYAGGECSACLASSGAVPRSVAGQLRLTAHRASLTGLTASPSVIPISDPGVANRTAAYLLTHWARGRPRDLGFSVEALLRLASVVGAPDVQDSLDHELRGRSEQPSGLAGCSQQIRDLRAAIAQQAACPYPILIEGETGSGKELVARALHHGGPRRGRAFCAVNCAALSDELFEAELFGHARGAFTGAVSQRAGLFEEAHRGTLFLDEVGELSPRAQAKLLRVVQGGEVRREARTPRVVWMCGSTPRRTVS